MCSGSSGTTQARACPGHRVPRGEADVLLLHASTLKPVVAMVATISSSFGLCRRVVSPAAARPSARMCISFSPKRPLKSKDMPRAVDGGRDTGPRDPPCSGAAAALSACSENQRLFAVNEEACDYKTMKDLPKLPPAKYL